MVESSDGVAVSARVSGEGPPLVLVHGTTGSKDSWAFVEPALAEQHTVWAYDRRGRGESEDAPDNYSLELEVNDLEAVLAAAGGSAHVLGHSFGGCVTLEMAVRGADLLSLVLYEPPSDVRRRSDETDRAIELIEAGDPDAGLKLQLGIAGLSDQEVEMVTSIPEVWARFVSTAPTISREVAALTQRPWDPGRYSKVDTPTLLLTGEVTNNDIYLSAGELREAIPSALHCVLPEQRHIAFATAPDAFVAAVLDFTTR